MPSFREQVLWCVVDGVTMLQDQSLLMEAQEGVKVKCFSETIVSLKPPGFGIRVIVKIVVLF